MSDKRYYNVAGFSFGVESPEEGFLDSMTNLAPFKSEMGSGEHVFDLEIVDALPAAEGEPMFRTDDGPGFPEIGIFTVADGWQMRVKPLPQLPEASEMWVKEDFSEAKLHFLHKDEKPFALNNSLMLMFAFSLLNDDNPILRLMPDGTARVFGSPWSGKTPCYKAEDAPAGAVVQLKQAPHNRIVRLQTLQAYATLMSSASSFRPFKGLADGWHRTLEGLVSVLPCYQLECLPDAAAAELCHSTIHG